MMKLSRSLFFLLPAGWLFTSCAEVSIADLGNLSRNAMSFNQQGAELGECGVVSQFERGRASASQSAGGG